MICRNREAGLRGVAHGGVALLWKESAVGFKRVDVKNPQDFEVLVCAGSIPGQTRKLVVVSCYLPPNYKRSRGEAGLEHISDVIVAMKQRFTDPYLVVTGDFNETGPLHRLNLHQHVKNN